MRNGKKFTKGFLPTLLVLIAILVVTCGGSSGNSTTTPTAAAKAPDSQQIFRYADGQTTDIATFDPALATDQPSAEAIDMVFTGLVSLNDQLQVTPQIAKSYSTSSNGLIWTFNLKPNLKFSDGTPLNANDVAYSITVP